MIDDWNSLTNRQNDVMQRVRNRQKMIESFIIFLLPMKGSQDGHILESIALAFNGCLREDNDENIQGAEWEIGFYSPLFDEIKDRVASYKVENCFHALNPYY